MWTLHNCFEPLNEYLRTKHPGIVIYDIGDEHHKPPSDHLPNSSGLVNAQDYMLGKNFRHADAVLLCSWLIQDTRTRYVIYFGKIWHVSTGEWRTYTGDNPHIDHVHHSVYDSAHLSNRAWKMGDDMPTGDEVFRTDIDPSAKKYSAGGALWTTMNWVRQSQLTLGQVEAEVKKLVENDDIEFDALSAALVTLNAKLDRVLEKLPD